MKTIKNISLYISFIICCLATCLPSNANAQQKGFNYGYRFGVGESKLDFEGVSTGSTKLMFTGGLVANYQFGRMFGLNADFMFTSKGGRMRGANIITENEVTSVNYYNDKYNLFYFEIPITAKLSIPLNESFSIHALAGPSINFKLLGLETREYDDATFNYLHGYENQEIKTLETIENSFVYGFGIEVLGKNNKTFFLDFRKNNSRNPIGYINNHQVKSSYFLISAGFKF